jgi:hypothetical protein
MKRRRHSEQDDSDSCSTLSTQNEEEAAEEAGQAAAPCERSAVPLQLHVQSHQPQLTGLDPRGSCRQQRLLQQREQCAAAKLQVCSPGAAPCSTCMQCPELCMCWLQLEEVLQRSRERHKHLAQQLEELAGCDSGSDAVDTSDLQRQLQASPAGKLYQLMTATNIQAWSGCCYSTAAYLAILCVTPPRPGSSCCVVGAMHHGVRE